MPVKIDGGKTSKATEMLPLPSNQSNDACTSSQKTRRQPVDEIQSQRQNACCLNAAVAQGEVTLRRPHRRNAVPLTYPSNNKQWMSNSELNIQTDRIDWFWTAGGPDPIEIWLVHWSKISLVPASFISTAAAKGRLNLETVLNPQPGNKRGHAITTPALNVTTIGALALAFALKASAKRFCP